MSEIFHTYHLEEYLNTVVVISDVASRNVTHMNMYATCEVFRILPGGVLEYSGGDY